MKFITIVFGILLITSAFATEDDENVSAASNILDQLVKEAQAALRDQKALWEVNHPLLFASLQSVVNAETQQASECSRKSADLDATNTEIQTCSHYIDWISNKIAENIRRLKELENNRCDQSKLYINRLKHNKIALKLIDFLKKAIEKKDSLSLVQRNELYDRLNVFLQMYTDHKIIEMIQTYKQDEDVSQYQVAANTTTQKRTDEEIGSKHVDDHRKNLTLEGFESGGRKSWPQYKQELLELLSKLEKTIADQSTQSQEDEMNAGITLVDFSIRVDKENKELDKHLSSESERYAALQTVKLQQEQISNACKGQLSQATDAKNIAQSEFDDQVEANKAKQASLSSEIDTFEYVAKQYELEVNHESSQGSRQMDSMDFINK